MRAPYATSIFFLSFSLVFSISSAYAQPIPEVSESLIDIGVTPKSTSRTKPFFVRNVGDETLIISNVIMSNAINFSASPTLFAVEPGDSEQVDVTLKPWWELGIFTTTITVVSFDAQPDSIQLEAIGEGVQDCALISVTPLTLYARLDEGEQSIQQLRIQNIGSQTLVWSRSSSDPVVRVIGGSGNLDPLAWRDMEVIFPYTPVPFGEHNHTITFTSNDPYKPTLIVPVDFSVVGDPIPAVSDTLIDFGVVPKSISHTKPFFVRNVGGETLIISNIIMSNEINFSASPTVLAIEPSDSGQVNVTLTPWWELGTFTTTITVVSVNAQPDSIVLEAIGEGVQDAPLISVTPMALYAALEMGEQSVQQLRIQNMGSIPLEWWRSSSDPVVRVTGGMSPLDPFAWRDLDVTFPYTPVPPGEYHYTITFTSNDPYNPTLIVPVDLSIPGAGIPVATADPDSIDFGFTYQGYPYDQTFTITNTGTGILLVSDITSDNGDFTVTPSTFSLGSLNSRDVTVTCTPTSAGVIEGTLTIVSNDIISPNDNVSLTAFALDCTPPVLSVPLDTIRAVVLPGGKSIQSLVISNLGQCDLNWDASIAPTGMEIILDGMRVLIEESQGQSSFFYGGAVDFIEAITAEGVSLVHNTNHLVTINMLSLYDAVLLTYGAGREYSQGELDAFRDYVLEGGSLMIHASHHDRIASMNSLLSSLGAGIAYPGGSIAQNPWVTDFINVGFTSGIDSIYQSGSNMDINVIPPGVVFANNDYQIHGAYFQNKGRVLVLANMVYQNSDVNVPGADNLQFMLQMFSWLNNNVPGRSLTPESGVTHGGLTATLLITFDATDMIEGIYSADIVLTHDGPGAVPTVVPAVMIVDSTATAIEDHAQQRDFILHQNHPNPFNPLTTILFHLPVRSLVNLSVYNVEGRVVKTLVDMELDRSSQKCRWDGMDSHGNPVSSGVYFYRLKAGGKVLTKKMVLLK
jgi:hypothetical protein